MAGLQRDFLDEERSFISAGCVALSNLYLKQSQMEPNSPTNLHAIDDSRRNRRLMIEITHKHPERLTAIRVISSLRRFANDEFGEIVRVIC